MLNLVSLEDLKKRLRIDKDDTSKDDVLNLLSEQITGQIEGYCERSFTSVSEVIEKIDIFDDQTHSVKISNIPIVLVLEVKNGSEVLSSSEYAVYDEGIITLLDNAYFEQGFQSAQITYTFGYASPPRDIWAVALETISRMYYSLGQEGISRMSIGDYSVAFRDTFHIRLSTEWSLLRSVLDKYKLIT